MSVGHELDGIGRIIKEQEMLLNEHTPLGELISTKPVYIMLSVTANSGKTTSVSLYPDDNKVWYISRVRLVTSANTKAIQMCRCKLTEPLVKIYEEQDVSIDSNSLTPPGYYYKDDFGNPIRCEQLKFVFYNIGTSNENQIIEIFGVESYKLYGSPKYDDWFNVAHEGDNVKYFKVPVVDVNVEDVNFPIKPPNTNTLLKTGKYCTTNTSICICNPNYTEAIVKTDNKDLISKYNNDPECVEIDEVTAFNTIKSWYPKSMFDIRLFKLRKVNNIYGFKVNTLGFNTVIELISCNSLPCVSNVYGLKFIVSIKEV